MDYLSVFAINCRSISTEAELAPVSGLLSDLGQGSLACFPEYFLDGAERYAGIGRQEAFHGLLELAKQRSIYLSFGMVENTDSKKHITGFLVDYNGKILGSQHKINPTSFEKASGILPGNDLTEIINTDFGTLAFRICFDQWRPDLSVGPEIVLHPRGFGLNDEKYGQFYSNWLMLDRTTAILRKAFLIGTTGDYGQNPLADIIDFEGNILAEKDSAGLVGASLDLGSLRDYRAKIKPAKTVPKF